MSRVELGIPDSCNSCPAAKVMLCAGSTLRLEGRGSDFPERVGGVLSGVVTDAALFGCKNPELAGQMSAVVKNASLNGTTELAAQVVRDFDTVQNARIGEFTPAPEVHTRLRRNLLKLF